MGFFQDLKEDLSQAVNELMPEEGEMAEETIAIDEKQAEDDLAEIEALLREKEEAQKQVQEQPAEAVKERKIDMGAIFNQGYSDEVSNITAGMVINGDITSQGCLELVGAVHGNINISGKMSITGIVEGNSQAAEIYAESAKITGEVRSQGTVKSQLSRGRKLLKAMLTEAQNHV